MESEEEYYLENKKSGIKTIVDKDIYEIYKDVNLDIRGGYTSIKLKILSHLVLGYPEKGFVVDHISGDTLDSRRSNLRFATYSENSQNKKVTSKSTYKNVHQTKSGKYNVDIRKEGNRYTYGSFHSVLNAAIHANIMMKELYGEFSKLNRDSDGNELIPNEDYFNEINRIKNELPKGITVKKNGKYHVRINDYQMRMRRTTSTVEEAINLLNNLRQKSQILREASEIVKKVEIKETLEDSFICYTNNRRGTFIISKQDYDKISDIKWTLNQSGYIKSINMKMNFLMHKYLLNHYERKPVDHKNGIRNDNRRENIHVVSYSQNNQNQKTIRSKSGYKGVCLLKSGKYIAQAKSGGNTKTTLGIHILI